MQMHMSHIFFNLFTDVYLKTAVLNLFELGHHHIKIVCMQISACKPLSYFQFVYRDLLYIVDLDSGPVRTVKVMMKNDQA